MLKKVKSIIMFFCLSVLVTNTAYTQIDSGLVGYWNFNENVGDTAFDSSPTNNHGLVTGATWILGISGSGLLFDGIDDFVKCISPGPLGGNPRTVTFWAKKNNPSTTYSEVTFSYGGSPSVNGADFKTSFNLNYVEGASVNVARSFIGYEASVVDDKWYFYSFVLPDITNPTVGDCLVYQDGILLTSVTTSSNIDSLINTIGNYPINIGRYADEASGNPNYFNGILDEVRVYDRALSQAEIIELYSQFTTNSLIIPSIIANPGSGIQPVMSNLSQPSTGATIPIKIPDGIVVDSISRQGLITENWNYSFEYIKPDSGFISVVLANSFGEIIPMDTTILFNIHFSKPDASCDTGFYIHWDTTLMGDISRQLTFSDTSNPSNSFYPTFGYGTDSSFVTPFISGDCDNSGTIDIADLVCMVEFMFQGGSAPVIISTMDTNDDSKGPDISDLVSLVAYMFQGGVAPTCTYITNNIIAAKLSTSINLSSTVINGKTVINLSSESNILGLELYVKGDNFSSIQSDFDNLDLLYRQDDNMVKIGLLDLEGAEYIPQGSNNIIELEGEFEIVSAIVVDDNLNSYLPLINSTANEGLLPAEFALNQNYPNPFNPTTQISFSLPEATNVKLEVFNINGQVVTTLADGQFEAGVHQLTWDGRETASGVYFYKLTTSKLSETKKMLLLK